MFGLEEVYNHTIKLMRSIVEDIRFGRELYLKPVETCSAQICKYLNNNEEIIRLVSDSQGKNPYMFSHPVNVALISYVLGKWMNLETKKLENLVSAGLLHDIGKAKIKDSILNKEEALTLDELEKLRSHPVIGYKRVNSVRQFDIQVLQGVLFHHERMDGSGYPLGLKGEKINMYSRIIAIADTFDAITADKTYNKKVSPLSALDEIQANSIDKLDSSICKIFVNNIVNYYNGRTVLLSNEKVGNIVCIRLSDIAKPMVCCENEYYDLMLENELEIVEFL